MAVYRLPIKPIIIVENAFLTNFNRSIVNNCLGTHIYMFIQIKSRCHVIIYVFA